MDFSRQNLEGPIAVGLGGYAWNKLKANSNVQNFVAKLGGLPSEFGHEVLDVGVCLQLIPGVPSQADCDRPL